MSDDTHVGIYTRISSDDGAPIRGLGVERQEHACREFADGRGWHVVDVYVDNNISASSFSDVPRPEYDRLLIDLASGRIDRILVLAQDRLLRRPETLEVLFRIHRKINIPTIECVSGPTIDVATSNGRTFARVKAVFDAAYSEYISEKVREKKSELARRGLPHGGGKRPFGYAANGIDLIPVEATLIREAIDRVLNEETLWGICRDWNLRGLTTVTGKEWSPAVLRETIRRPRNAGLREYHRQIKGPAVWPAIIDETTRLAVLRCLDAHTKRRGQVFLPRLLTGLITCGKCGANLCSGGHANHRDYRCAKAPGRPGCGHTCIRARPVEDHVTLVALAHLDHLAAEPLAADPDDLLADRHALDELARQRFVERALDDHEYIAARAPLQHRIHVAELALKTDGFDITATRSAWESFTVAERRCVLQRAIIEIRVLPDRRTRRRVDLRRLDIRLRTDDTATNSPTPDRRAGGPTQTMS